MARNAGRKDSSPHHSRWLGPLVFAGAVAIVYAPVLRKLAADWWSDPDYSYAFICVPVAVVMMASRRDRWLTPAARPSTWGLALSLASIAMLLVGRLGAELFLTRVSLVGLLAGALVFVRGWQPLRILLLPIALILLTIPVPAVIMTQVTVPLQLFASATTELVLNAAHIPVFREGNVLMLPNTTLEVAEACSGIRSLTALLTLALLIAQSVDRRALGRLAIVAASIPVAVLVNVMRVSITAVGAYTYGEAAAQGLVHEALGWVMFVVGCGLLWMFSKVVVRTDSRLAVRCAS